MTVKLIHSCPWAGGDDALMARYHDEEWGVPQRDPRMLWAAPPTSTRGP